MFLIVQRVAEKRLRLLHMFYKSHIIPLSFPCTFRFCSIPRTLSARLSTAVTVSVVLCSQTNDAVPVRRTLEYHTTGRLVRR